MTQTLTLTPVSGTERGKRLPWRTIAVLAGFTLAGACFGYGIGKFGKPYLKSLTAAQIAWVAIAPWLAIAWHELGHVIGGWLSGFQLRMYAVGPLLLERRSDGLRVRFNRTLQYWGGVAATVPGAGYPHDLERLRRAMLRVVSFGPLFSLIGLCAATLGTYGVIFAAFSLAIAIATLVPMRTSGFYSDGARTLQLLRKGPEARRWAALAAVIGMGATIRPKDWPEQLVYTAAHPLEASFDGVSGAWLLSSWHFDRGELADAESALAWAIGHAERWPAPMRCQLYASAALFTAWVKQDADAAQGWMERTGKVVRSTPGGQLAEAALLLVQGRKTEAFSLLDRIDVTDAATRELMAQMRRN